MSKAFDELHILRKDKLLTFDESVKIDNQNSWTSAPDPHISHLTESNSRNAQFNPKTRTQSIQLAVHNAYVSLGVKPKNSRAKLHIQIRSAIGVALSEHFNTYEIGAALNRDRSSVSHYTTKHSQNLKYWEGYRGIYETVKEEIDSVTHDYVLEMNIETLTSRIAKLQAIKQGLILTLENQK